MDTNVLKRFAQEARISLQKKVLTKIDLVLHEESAARRESPKAVQDLESKIRSASKERVIEQVAYTWFNRFTALLYMDMNGYNRVRVIAPSEGQTRPEILSEASAGSFEDALISENTQNIVRSLLDGRSASSDPDNEAYRYLVVSVCNAWHSTMPFLFERIADYTELLMPDDLLSSKSILVQLRAAMTEENCQDVEVIGWLYQFYISEKKDEVSEGLKKNQKVTPENIPAATQLFTPSWIVKYLVENSLGRLWMLNNPNSNLIHQMEYYIALEEPETDFLEILSPEEIKICDPACGSGHMLTYSFDLLYSIYQEVGYDEASIPTLILQNNLYGIELDKRAGELSAFALTMKARRKNRRFFRNPIQPQICVLENISFDMGELNEYMDNMGQDLFTHPLRITLAQFEESDNFGSLIQPALEDLDGILEKIQSKDISSNLFLKSIHDRVLQVLHQTDYLRQKYHVIVANPPYLGGKKFNNSLKAFAGEYYAESKNNLYSMFMERIFKLIYNKGFTALVTMESWMFLPYWEKLRLRLLSDHSLLSVMHLANGVMGIAYGTVAMVWRKEKNITFETDFFFVSMNDLNSNLMPVSFPPANKNRYKVAIDEFDKIPGKRISYWLSDKMRNVFSNSKTMQQYAVPKQGLATGDNERFLRYWYEVSNENFKLDALSRDDAKLSEKKWFPCNKGGKFRRWFGNNCFVVNWQFDGQEIRNFRDKGGKLRSRPQNLDFYFKEGVTWSTATNGNLSMRYSPVGHIFETKGSLCIPLERNSWEFPLGLMNTKVIDSILLALSPTIDYHEGPIGEIPLIDVSNQSFYDLVKLVVKISKNDWDAFETSWNFESLPLLSSNYPSVSLEKKYQLLRSKWHGLTDEMLKSEEEINRIFINNYGLQDELTPDVPIHEITLTCNPAYRYGKKMSQEVKEEKLLGDTIKELISYAVGCMFGRYALEKPGLILSNAGETIEDYLQKVPNTSFPADDDNVIPILDGDWFDDDITERFRKFLRVTFGEDRFTENLHFIESSIGKNIRNYFLRDFYKDHVQTYKKRPIYWQFSSPKGSFNALIYMHRYNRNTVSIILDQYLRQFKVKLISQKKVLEMTEVSTDLSQSEKTKAITQLQKLDSILQELETWERDVIFPLASQRIEIDLDDGVKTNYIKFKTALTKIPGLS